MQTTTPPTDQELANLSLQRGRHPHMQDPEYFALAALSSTELRGIDRSPAYAKQCREQGIEVTDAMQFGTMVHARVYDQPGPKYVPFEGDRRTKAGKLGWSAILEDGNVPIKRPMFEKIADCAASVLAHPGVQKLLDAADAIEEVVTWERDGVLCKSKKDARSGSCMWDLKTCTSVDKFSPWKISDMLYHVQAAWYLDGEIRAGLHSCDSFRWVTVSTTAPYEVAIFEATDDTIKRGFEKVDELFATYQECVKRDSWPRHFLNVRAGDLPYQKSK